MKYFNKQWCYALTLVLLTGCGASSPKDPVGAVDPVGAKGIAVIEDTQAPTVSVTSHEDITTKSGLPGEVTVSGKVTDDHDIASLTIKVNDATEIDLLVANAEFTHTLTLTKATNVIVVTAADSSGNKTQAQRSINYIAFGELDPSFGGDVNPADGIADGFSLSDVNGSHDKANMFLIAEDGSIFVTGQARNPEYDMLLWKLKADGSLDTSFAGGDGFVTFDHPTGVPGSKQHDFANALAFDRNGDVIIVGQGLNASDNDNDLLVVKFNASTGELDTGFGEDQYPNDGSPDGFIVVDASGSGSQETGNALAIDTTGRIYVAGTSDNDLFVWRLTSAGIVDKSFNGDTGYVSYNSGSADIAVDILIDKNGSILVAGKANGLLLWRFDVNANNDMSFGTNGLVTEATATAVGHIILDNQNNILVSGSIADNEAVEFLILSLIVLIINNSNLHLLEIQ